MQSPIQVPERFDVELDSMGGGMVYRNVNRRHDFSGEGTIVLSTMGGAINVDDAPDGADLNTLGGSIHVGSAGGPVKAKTNGGDVRIDRLDGSVSGIEAKDRPAGAFRERARWVPAPTRFACGPSTETST